MLTMSLALVLALTFIAGIDISIDVDIDVDFEVDFEVDVDVDDGIDQAGGKEQPDRASWRQERNVQGQRPLSWSVWSPSQACT